MALHHIPPDVAGQAHDDRVHMQGVFLGLMACLSGLFYLQLNMRLSDAVFDGWYFVRARGVSGFERLLGIYLCLPLGLGGCCVGRILIEKPGM